MASVTDIPEWCFTEGLGGSFAYHPVSGEQLKPLFDRSPIKYVEAVRTPLLLGIGEDDLRVPPSQGLEYFKALKAIQHSRDGGSSECVHRLLWYPKNGHPLAEAESEADYWVNTALFFAHHLK
eukprot:GDKI01042933.1.p1 GENE.GDKI01042933.1~~GDKI01042933.1.p1  ORF type:complete len:123 (+),score=40.73 GDKI01042933.1:134-502(+)